MNEAVVLLRKREKDIKILHPSSMATIPRIYNDICESAKISFESIDDKVKFEDTVKLAY